MLYVPTKERSPFGSVIGIGAAFFPPGVTVPGAEGLDVFEGLMQQLQPLGVYTPWATRVGSMDWSLISQPPDTNIAVGKLDDSLYRQTLSIGFGAPLPFIGVHTPALPTPSQIEDAFVGTPYSLYETQAVYDQRDTDEPPKITFLHWLQIRAPTDTNTGNASLSTAAAKINGKLVALMQIGYTDSKSRDIPLDSFQTVFDAQFAPPGGGDGSTLVDIDASLPPTASKSGLGMYQVGIATAIAVACGIGGYAVYRAATNKPTTRRVVVRRRSSPSRAIVKR
jgi:hypothetical protein